MKREWTSVPGAVTQEDVHGVGGGPSSKRRQFTGDFGPIFDIPLPLLLLGCCRIFQPTNIKTIASQTWTTRNLEADVVTERGKFSIFGPSAATNLDQRQKTRGRES